MIDTEKVQLNLKRLMCTHFGHNWYRVEDGGHGPVFACGCGSYRIIKGWNGYSKQK